MPNGYGDLKILATSVATTLADEVCQSLGQPYSRAKMFIGQHEDGEIRLEILDNIRSKDAFLIASGQQPDRNFLEILWALDAMRTASAGRITLVMPYYPYSRSDKAEEGRREPIGASLVARLIETAGANHCLLMDLHNSAITGFFNKAVCDRIHATMVLVPKLKQLLAGRDFVVASPDAGGVPRALKFAEKMKQDSIVYFSKARSAPGVIRPGSINISTRVDGLVVVLVDDMIGTGGTMVEDAKVAIEAGATAVIAVAPHAVCPGKAIERLAESPLEYVLTANSVIREGEVLPSKFVHISIGELLAHAITSVHMGHSLQQMRGLEFSR